MTPKDDSSTSVGAKSPSDLRKAAPYDEVLVVLTLPCASWAYHLADNAANALQAIGYRVRPIRIDSGKARGKGSVRALHVLTRRKAKAGHRFFVLDFNARVLLDVVAEFGIPYFSWIGDHPFDHMEALQYLSSHAIIGVIDRAHRRAARAAGIKQKIVFTPHGAPEFDDNLRPMAKRDIGLLFAAGVKAPISCASWIERNPSLPEVISKAMFSAAEAVIEEGTDSCSAIESALRQGGIEPWEELNPDALWRMVGTVDFFAESEVRFRVLSSLASLPLHFIGPDLPACYAPFSDRWTCHGSKPYDDVKRLMANSRIGLNTIAKFSDGSHERVWEAMACGAVTLTDRTPYLAESFTDGENILFLPRGPEGRDDLADRLAALLEHPDALENIAAAGCVICAAGHLWTHRAVVIDRAMAEAADPGRH
jgi:glycosyl transferase family 1